MDVQRAAHRWLGMAVGAVLSVAGEATAQQVPPNEAAPAAAPVTENQPVETAVENQPVETAAESRPADAAPESEKPAEKKAGDARRPKVTSKAWGTRVDTEPPSYVKTLDQFGVAGFEKADWLEFGLQNITRYEYRDDDYTHPIENRDDRFLMRTLGYVGVRKVFDPLRFGLEFEDSRMFGSQYPDTNRDTDENDFLQAFGELYFADALGPGYPIQFRAGRMAFDLVDRRLMARANWRNTLNSFDGFRLRLGQPSADWQVDFFAAQPVERRVRQPDRPDEEQWFYGLVGAWRGWSQVVTLEPYYFILDQDRTDPTKSDRTIHTMGLHAFGPIPQTRFDYDMDAAFQFGEDGELAQRALAIYSELGYTFDHAWRPRLSVSGQYASGDSDPDDGTAGRFDRLFETTHPYSMLDFWSWQNVITPRLRWEVQPIKPLRIDASYGAFWLATDDDAWVVPNRKDPSGSGGNFVGQDIDVRLRYQVDKHLEVEIGYAHFLPGTFAKNSGPADDADMFYVQTTLQF